MRAHGHAAQRRCSAHARTVMRAPGGLRTTRLAETPARKKFVCLNLLRLFSSSG